MFGFAWFCGLLGCYVWFVLFCLVDGSCLDACVTSFDLAINRLYMDAAAFVIYCCVVPAIWWLFMVAFGVWSIFCFCSCLLWNLLVYLQYCHFAADGGGLPCCFVVVYLTLWFGMLLDCWCLVCRSICVV